MNRCCFNNNRYFKQILNTFLSSMKQTLGQWDKYVITVCIEFSKLKLPMILEICFATLNDFIIDNFLKNNLFSLLENIVVQN